MSLVFPLSIPTYPGVNSFNMAANSTVGAAVSPFTGQTQTVEWPGEAWDLQVGLPPMTRVHAEKWIAFLTSLRGMSGSFLIGDPYGTVPQGIATGVPETDSSSAAVPAWVLDTSYSAGNLATENGETWICIQDNDGSPYPYNSPTFWSLYVPNLAGSKTLFSKGWTANKTGILLAGDYLQIGYGISQRLYKVLTDTDSDSGGYATIDIFPRLRETLTDGTDIATTNTAGCFRLAANRNEWTIALAAIYGINFKAIEYLGPVSEQQPLPSPTGDVPIPIVDGGAFIE